jgi:hypothetical protein
MTLRKTIEIVNTLANQGAIERYAITGAVAALYYIEPTLTEDLDILVSIGSFETRPSGLILLGPLETALAKLGYAERTDVGVLVEGWPVQFLPVASKLDAEALDRAADVEFQLKTEAPIHTRILRAEYVVANALKLGRLKDLARVEAFLENKAVDLKALKSVLDRYQLMPAWKNFCFKAGIPDLLV